MESSIIKHREATVGRIERFITDQFYTEVNLRGKLYPYRLPVTCMHHHAASGKISYQEALQATYKPVKPGEGYGPTWSTHWFRLELDLPRDWLGREVRLIWESDTECMVWENGRAMQGLSGSPDSQLRNDYIISRALEEAECERTLYVEMACTGMFGEGQGSIIHPPNLNKAFHIQRAEVVVVDSEVRELLADFDVLLMMAKDMKDTNEHRANQAMFAANKMINDLNFDDRKTFSKARNIAKEIFDSKNGDNQLTIYAMGHCHIDCAWLWAYDETRRKCGRSWASTLLLMDRYPNITFACSQAQQYQWVKDLYPEIYEDIKRRVAEGRFAPVGGAWVEMDGNLPSGESFVRQVLYGQRFFMKEFGVKCTEFWLPDTFGYSAQLPQIASLGGMNRFLTQKISWGVNRFPHHTFMWEGIDGTRVLTHFPPGDNYGMNAEVKELLKTVNNCEDKGRVRNFAFLYGYGDGGGGPTEKMIERLERLQDVDGLPKVKHGSPAAFFDAVEKTDRENICRWVGELYLEFHQGTYTTQAKTKRYNRKCEFLLRDIEVVATMAAFCSGAIYPREELDRLWKMLLLNQFHDVLPGSSINQVYKDAEAIYEEIVQCGSKLLGDHVSQFANLEDGSDQVTLIMNTLGWEFETVVEIQDQTPAPWSEASPNKRRKKSLKQLPENTQRSHDGKTLAVMKLPAFSCVANQTPGVACSPVSVTVNKDAKGGFRLEGAHLIADLDNAGRITYLYHKETGRTAVAEGQLGNQLVLFDDTPGYWDAWDVNHFHLETRRPLNDVIGTAEAVEEGPLRVTVKVTIRVSAESTVTQYISMTATEPTLLIDTQVDWHESHKFLKVEYPWSVRSHQAAYDIAFGHVYRPTHWNTMWDWMKFEVCGHKWADLSEHGFGVALLNDSKYGYSCHDNIMRLSLLRSPKSPDEAADMGSHEITYAVYPHAGDLQTAHVNRLAYQLNSPPRVFKMENKVLPPDGIDRHLLSCNSENVVLDTVKMDEDDQGHIVLRMHETFGTPGSVTIHTAAKVTKVRMCNILEEPQEDQAAVRLNETNRTEITVKLKAFQIITLRLALEKE